MKELKILKKLKLADSEKRELFSRISNSIRAFPEGSDVNLKYPVPSPFYRFSFLSASVYFRAGVLGVFILMLTSGTALASLNALPGDLLYSIKVNVAEKVAGIGKLSSESRAKENSSIIEKRIKEFEKLAEKGRLTAENSKTLEKSIDENLKSFDRNVGAIKDKEGARAAVAEIEAELQSSLEKHSEKIIKIREDERVSDKRALQSVLERVAPRRSEENKEDEEREESSRRGGASKNNDKDEDRDTERRNYKQENEDREDEDKNLPFEVEIPSL